MLLGDLGENLDEVEGPAAPRVLLGVRQPLEPRLKLVQNEQRGLLLEHLDEDQVAGHVGLLVAEALPLALEEFPVRVPLEQNVPEKLVPMKVEALGDHAAVGTQLDSLNFWPFQLAGPLGQPLVPYGGGGAEMVQCSE